MKANLERLLKHASREKLVERFVSGWGTGRTLAVVSWKILLAVLISYVGLLFRTVTLDMSTFVLICAVLFVTCMFVLPSLLILRAMQVRFQSL